MSRPNSWRSWKILLRAIVSRSRRQTSGDEDPDILLARAQSEMRALQVRSREKAVRAITHKNQLQSLVQTARQDIDDICRKLEEALAAGDEGVASRLHRRKEEAEAYLRERQELLSRAEESVRQVKSAIKREEEVIRRRTAQALALQAQWKLVRIEQAVTLSLAQISARGGDADSIHLTREQIRARHARNRHYATEALTQKNQLQMMVDGAEVQVANLRDMVSLARRKGDDALECLLLREMEQYEATLAQSREALDRARVVTERARELVQEESERVRQFGDSLLLRAEDDEAERRQAKSEAEIGRAHV